MEHHTEPNLYTYAPECIGIREFIILAMPFEISSYEIYYIA